MSAITPIDGATYRRTAVAMAVIVVFSTLLFAVVAKGYDRFGTRLLARMDVSVGEVLMKEGMRCKEAGQLENAKERFTTALASRFAGEQNRVYTLKLLGVIYWGEGNYAKSLPLLDEAAKSPEAEATWFGPYCDTLYHLGKYDEAAAAVERWQQAVARRGDKALMADAKYYEGLIAVARQDADAATRAFAEGAALNPASNNAAELAALLLEQKDYAGALKQAEAYLAASPTGSRAEAMRVVKRKAEAMLTTS